MTIEVPTELEEDFINFLIVSLNMFAEDELTMMTESEREVIDFLENLVGKGNIGRFTSLEDKSKAMRMITSIMNRV
jgi:hypothetical protein